MRLSVENNYCPTCGTQLREAIQRIAKEDFCCPICGSNMRQLKEECRTRLFDFQKILVIAAILNQCHPDLPDDDEELEEILTRSSLTIDEVIEFLRKKELCSKSSETPIEKLVEANFRSVFGTDSADISIYA